MGVKKGSRMNATGFHESILKRMHGIEQGTDGCCIHTIFGKNRWELLLNRPHRRFTTQTTPSMTDASSSINLIPLGQARPKKHIEDIRLDYLSTFTVGYLQNVRKMMDYFVL